MKKNRILADIRNAIQRSTLTKTIEQLESEGQTKVRVIRESRVTELIAQAVDRALEERPEPAEPGEKERLTEASVAEFRKLLQGDGASKEVVENQRHLIQALQERIADLERAASDRESSRTSAVDHETLLSELKEAREENRKLRQEMSGDGSLRSMKQELQELMSSQMESVAQLVAKQFRGLPADQQRNPVEAAKIMLDNLFATPEAVESNIDSLEVKSAEGAGIAGNLERLKKLGMVAKAKKTASETAQPSDKRN